MKWLKYGKEICEVAMRFIMELKSSLDASPMIKEIVLCYEEAAKLLMKLQNSCQLLDASLVIMILAQDCEPDIKQI